MSEIPTPAPDNQPQPSITPKEKTSLLTNPTLMGWLTIIGFPLGILGIYLSFYFNKEAKPVYKVVSDVAITQSEADSKIRVFYDSIEVENVRAVTIAIWNAGNEFLDKDAISKDRPISFRCNKPVSILNIKTVTTTRPDLQFTSTYYVDQVQGTPSDTISGSYDYVTTAIEGDEGLEAEDGAVFTILYTTKAKDASWVVIARIKGIPDGIRFALGTQSIVKEFYIIASFTILTIIIYVVGDRKRGRERLSFRILFAFLLIVTALMSYLTFSFLDQSVDVPETLTSQAINSR